MRLTGIVLFGLAAWAMPTWGLQVGDAREAVIAELGAPQGEMMLRGQKHLLYPGGMVVLQDGRVSQLDPGIRERTAERALQAKREAAQAERLAAERALHARAAAQAENVRRTAAPAAAVPTAGTERIREIRQRGQRIELSALLEPGKITIVDFFADWCGPCRALAPHLEALARRDGDLTLSKVDIVSWGTPVTAQYGITSVPHVRVYNRSGQPVGRPTSNYQEIVQFIGQARR